MVEQEIRERLAEYRTAESAVLKNQSYTIGNRTFSRANLRHIQSEIANLQRQLDGFTGGGSIRVRKALFRDD